MIDTPSACRSSRRRRRGIDLDVGNESREVVTGRHVATEDHFQGTDTTQRENRNGASKVHAVAHVDAQVLGGFSVAVDGRTVAPSAWGRLSAERLVKLLLVTRGHDMSREDVGEALWPEAAPDRQATNVRKALHFAKRAFDAVSGGMPILSTERDRLSLAETVELDLDLDRLLNAFALFDGTRRRTTNNPPMEPSAPFLLSATMNCFRRTSMRSG